MNARIWVTMLGVAMVLPYSVSAQSLKGRAGAADRVTVGRARRTAHSDDLARNLLLKRVEEVDWEDEPFGEVVKWLEGQGDDKVNVIPRWRSLREENVEPESFVTLRIRNASVADVLNEVLDQLSEDGVLRYVAKTNTIRITTRKAMERHMETRVYRVTDLTFNFPDMARSAPIVDLQSAARQSRGGGGGGSQSVFRGGSSSSQDLVEKDQDREERLDDLKTMIETHIEPATWQPAGGDGVVSIVGDRQLVVTNTIDVHEKIGGFLSAAK